MKGGEGSVFLKKCLTRFKMFVSFFLNLIWKELGVCVCFFDACLSRCLSSDECRTCR